MVSMNPGPSHSVDLDRSANDGIRYCFVLEHLVSLRFAQ
jgi:hypothetical protein